MEHKFLVVDYGQMPYYFLVGMEFLQKYGLPVDVGSEHLMKGEKAIARAQFGDACAAGFIGSLKMGVRKEELLTIQDVEENARILPNDY